MMLLDARWNMFSLGNGVCIYKFYEFEQVIKEVIKLLNISINHLGSIVVCMTMCNFALQTSIDHLFGGIFSVKKIIHAQMRNDFPPQLEY